MSYIFEKNEYNLPDHLRPDCHRLKSHSYKSVFGRMHWDQPAQTITSGFTSMGQGRFVHPKEQRTLTPHEAARLQFIPDFLRFDDGIGRTTLAEMIGNALPAKLTYVIGLELLR
jgi:DNA (cytosine-5)-methyltransferase 1